MNSKFVETRERLAGTETTVGVVGLGYVGLPLAVTCAQAGMRVIGFDTNELRCRAILDGENYIGDIPDESLKAQVSAGRFSATTSFQEIRHCDAVMICVPTPLDKFKKPDMSYIEEAGKRIGENMGSGVLISLESTTYPTTTEGLLLPILESSSGMSHGKDFWLCYSPERVDPGNPNYKTDNTPKVLGGLGDQAAELGRTLYRRAIESLHVVSSPRVAEMVKILENTYRLVNISLINELTLLAERMNINIWEVIEAASSKPFGFQAFYPGPGIGGHCIPLDPFYLEFIAKEFHFNLTMINTAGVIEDRMPHYMTVKIAYALNQHRKPLNGSRLFFVGVAYKPDIADERESPALKIMDEVAQKLADVSYHDPYIPNVRTPRGTSYRSRPLTGEEIEGADCVVITTAHSGLDVGFIESRAKLVVDFQNAIPHPGPHVHKLGTR